MSLLNLVFSVISAILMLYMVLLMIRVLATWFTGSSTPAIIAWLGRLTDPYLNLFRGLRFLRFQYLDLSPLAGLGVLVFLQFIFAALATAQSIWFGLVLSVFLEILGMTIASVFSVFAILALIRLVSIFAKASSVNQLWYALDHILQPLVYPVAGLLSPRKVMPYGTALGIFIALMAAGWFLSRWGFGLLAGLARSIPF